jgi:hypothetical protein
MDGTYIIAIAITLIVVVTVALFSIQSRKNAKKKSSEMVQIYNNIVQKEGLTIVHEERLDNKIFALDPLRKVFLYIYSYERPVYDIIQLNNFSSCKMVNKDSTGSSSFKGKTISPENTTRVDLSFMLNSEPVIAVPVYNEIQDGLADKLKLAGIANDWQNKINAVISG